MTLSINLQDEDFFELVKLLAVRVLPDLKFSPLACVFKSDRTFVLVF